jgi:hypothetical protein
MELGSISIIIGALLAVSEALALIPNVKGYLPAQKRRNNHGIKRGLDGQNRDGFRHANT